MEENNSNFGSSIKLTGRVVNRRLNVTATGKHVLNLFVRTKTYRNFYFGISATLWGDEATKLADAINECTDAEDGETIDEKDGVVVTIEGELAQSTWEDSKTKEMRSRYYINAFAIKLEE